MVWPRWTGIGPGCCGARASSGATSTCRWVVVVAQPEVVFADAAPAVTRAALAAGAVLFARERVRGGKPRARLVQTAAGQERDEGRVYLGGLVGADKTSDCSARSPHAGAAAHWHVVERRPAVVESAGAPRAGCARSHRPGERRVDPSWYYYWYYYRKAIVRAIFARSCTGAESSSPHDGNRWPPGTTQCGRQGEALRRAGTLGAPRARPCGVARYVRM